MKAQLRRATTAGSWVDGATMSPGDSSATLLSWSAAAGLASSGCAPSPWSPPVRGDFRWTWFWCKQEVKTRWLWGGQDRQSAGPVPEQVRQAGLQGRHAWTEDKSTQFSRERLRSCCPDVKPGGHNFTQPCRKREKPGLHSGWRGGRLISQEGVYVKNTMKIRPTNDFWTLNHIPSNTV